MFHLPKTEDEWKKSYTYFKKNFDSPILDWLFATGKFSPWVAIIAHVSKYCPGK